jgi:hypothetical protein
LSTITWPRGLLQSLAVPRDIRDHCNLFSPLPVANQWGGVVLVEISTIYRTFHYDTLPYCWDRDEIDSWVVLPLPGLNSLHSSPWGA